MTTSEASNQRLTNLEIKATYTEDLVDHLDKIIARQQLQIDQLLREVRQLRDLTPEITPLRDSLTQDDLPPHF